MPPSEYPATTAIKVLTLSIWPPWLHRPIPSWLIFDRNIKSGIIDFFPTLAGARCDCARTLSSLYIRHGELLRWPAERSCYGFRRKRCDPATSPDAIMRKGRIKVRFSRVKRDWVSREKGLSRLCVSIGRIFRRRSV
jgi:hypothetical protein